MRPVTDVEIPIGSNWDEFLKKYVAKCDIMILCVSHDFMNSKYIRENEFGEALQRLQKGHRLLIVPVYFMTCEIHQDTKLSALQFFKPDGKKFGAHDDEDFSFSTLVTFTNDNTVRVNKNNWHKYMVELKKKIEHAWEELNKENKRAN
jgi:internalin A